MALVQRRAGPFLPPVIIAALSAIAEEHGISMRHMHQAINRAGGDARKAIIEFGSGAYRDFRQYLSELGMDHNGKPEQQLAKQPNAAVSGQKRLRGGEVAPSEETKNTAIQSAPTPDPPVSFSDSPPTAQLSGGAEMPGGEDNVLPVSHIWRRFPNVQTTALKWIATQYCVNDLEAANPQFADRQPFNHPERQTATNLSVTGGGAWTDLATQTYANQTYINTGEPIDYQRPRLYQLRMTTPYNILKSAGKNIGINTAVTNSQPMWISYWDQKYQYYHVLQCNWKIKFNFFMPQYGGGPNGVTGPYQKDVGLSIFWRYTNIDDPPLEHKINTSTINRRDVASNNNAETGANREIVDADFVPTTYLDIPAEREIYLTSDDYESMGGWNRVEVAWDNTKRTTAVLTGSYNFGDCQMDLKTMLPADVGGYDTGSEMWSIVGTTARFPENLSIIVVNDAGRNVSGILVPTTIQYETEHVIQWRDLRSNYKFPTLTQVNSLSPITNMPTDEIHFKRGAAYT